MKYLPIIIIAAALIFRIQVANFRLGYEMSFLFTTTILFSIYLISKKYIYPGLFLILCCFASYYPICSLTSIQSLRFVLTGVILYYILAESNLDQKMVYNMLCVVCLVHISFLVLQFFKIEPYLIYGMTTNGSHTGLTANPNEASAMIALCSPAFFRKKWAWFIPVIIIGLFIAKSFGGILAFSLIVAVFFTMKDFRFLTAAAPLLLLFLAYFVAENQGTSDRVVVWIAAVKLYFKENILTGFGLGHWEYISKKYLSEAYEARYFHRAHNTFLQCWFGLGMGFIVLLGFYCKSLINKAKSNPIFIFALISIFISCNVNSVFRINALNGMIIIIWLAMINNGLKNENL